MTEIKKASHVASPTAGGSKDADAFGMYAITEKDEYLIDLLRRIAQQPGHHLGNLRMSSLAAFIKGYLLARFEAGLPSESDLLLGFTRWVMQTRGNPTLEAAMQSVGADDRVEPFLELFDRYLKERGTESGLMLRDTIMDRYRRERGIGPGEVIVRSPVGHEP